MKKVLVIIIAVVISFSVFCNVKKANNAERNSQKNIIKYDKVISQNPNNADIYFARGLANLKTKNYFDAMNDFDQAIKLNPNDSKFYKYRGVAKYEVQYLDAAYQDIERALQLSPNDKMAISYKKMIEMRIKKKI